MITMESRPRVSRRAAILGGLVVVIVTFVVLIAEGIFTFSSAKTSNYESLLSEASKVGRGAEDESSQWKDSAVSAANGAASKSNSSPSSTSKGGGNSDDHVTRIKSVSSTDKASLTRNSADEDDDIRTSESGLEACKSLSNDVITPTSKCHPCNEHDKSHVPECSTTGRIEQVVTCRGGKPTQRRYRACRRLATPEEEEAERNFFVFEAVNFGVGVAAYVLVLLRRKKLDSALAKKIEEQLATGV